MVRGGGWENERVREWETWTLGWRWPGTERRDAATRPDAHSHADARTDRLCCVAAPSLTFWPQTIRHLKCLANFCMASDNDSGPVYCECSGTKWCWILPYLKVVKHEMHQPQGHHNTFGLSGKKVFGWVTFWNNGYHKRLLSLLRLV